MTFRKRACSLTEAEDELRKGPWTLEEDTFLSHYVACHGEGRWNLAAKAAGLKRTGKSCRLRWLNYLKPDIKRGNLTPEEQVLILELHSKWGNRWSKIARYLPGRTDNEIKNYWRTRVQKQARQLNIDSDSKKFVEALRSFWKPRLLQKMKQNSFSSDTSTSQDSANSSSLQNSAICSQTPSLRLPNILTSNMDNSSQNMNLDAIPSDMFSDSMRLPQLSETWDRTSSSFNTFDSTVYDDQYFPGCNKVDDRSNFMGGSPLDDAMSATVFVDKSVSDIQVAENDWVSGSMTDVLWNMDDIWQFRDQGEKTI